MKEIKITPPEGYEIDKEASTFDCIKFKLKPVEKKNLTWEEIQKKNVGKKQYFLNTSGFIINSTLNTSIKDSRANVPAARIAEKIRALCQLYIIAEYYNEGWEPDWNDRYQNKYLAFWSNLNKEITTMGIYELSISFPVFKSEEILKAAYEANREIFETALKP